MKTGYVYMITSPSGKIYIGSTDNIERRWKRYKVLNCKGQTRLYASLKKYGFENHIFEILWYGDIIDMLKYECLIGTYYEALDSKMGMVCKLPKYSDSYQCISDETRERMKISQTGLKRSDEQRMKMSLSGRGKHSRILSEETKDKIRKGNLGKKRSKECNIEKSKRVKEWWAMKKMNK